MGESDGEELGREAKEKIWGFSPDSHSRIVAHISPGFTPARQLGTDARILSPSVPIADLSSQASETMLEQHSAAIPQ